MTEWRAGAGDDLEHDLMQRLRLVDDISLSTLQPCEINKRSWMVWVESPEAYYAERDPARRGALGIEKMRYIHHNRVKAGMYARPENWQWGRFLYYATGFAMPVENRIGVDGAKTRTPGGTAVC